MRGHTNTEIPCHNGSLSTHPANGAAAAAAATRGSAAAAARSAAAAVPSPSATNSALAPAPVRQKMHHGSFTALLRLFYGVQVPELSLQAGTCTVHSAPPSAHAPPPSAAAPADAGAAVCRGSIHAAVARETAAAREASKARGGGAAEGAGRASRSLARRAARPAQSIPRHCAHRPALPPLSPRLAATSLRFPSATS
eukprot:gene15952-biopygen2860